MKQVVSLLKRDPKYQYIIFFMLIFIMHLKMNIFNDDSYFLKAAQDGNWFSFLSMRYQTWSSRILIEFLILIFITLPMWIWKVVNSGVILLAIHSINRVFSEKKSTSPAWFVAALFFMYPWFHMATAGWITTSINYLWPASFFLYSLIYIRKIFDNETIRFTESVSYHLAFFISNSHEQILLISLLLYCLYFSYAVWNKYFSKVKYIFSYITLSVINLFIILSTPGLKLRYLGEINTHFPNFHAISTIDKFSIGLSTTLTHFVTLPNLLFAFMLVMVCLLLSIKKSSFGIKAKTYWILPISLALYNIHGLFNAMQVKRQSKLFITLNDMYGIKSLAGVSNIDHHSFYCSSALLVLFFTLIAYLIYEALDSPEDQLIIFSALLCGFASHVSLGFSPTIYASSFRTFIFAYVALIITIVILYESLSKILTESKNRVFNRFVLFITIIGYVTNLASVLIVNYLKGT